MLLSDAASGEMDCAYQPTNNQPMCTQENDDEYYIIYIRILMQHSLCVCAVKTQQQKINVHVIFNMRRQKKRTNKRT